MHYAIIIILTKKKFKGYVYKITLNVKFVIFIILKNVEHYFSLCAKILLLMPAIRRRIRVKIENF